MTTPHKHAAILRAIADGVEVEYRPSRTSYWTTPIASANPISSPEIEWRIKPTAITVGKHSWPEPMRVAPADGTKYFVVILNNMYGPLIEGQMWDGLTCDQVWLSRGICHLTKEAAKQHAQALISISRGMFDDHTTRRRAAGA